jgi:hypothetical protein
VNAPLSIYFHCDGVNRAAGDFNLKIVGRGHFVTPLGCRFETASREMAYHPSQNLPITFKPSPIGPRFTSGQIDVQNMPSGTDTPPITIEVHPVADTLTIRPKHAYTFAIAVTVLVFCVIIMFVIFIFWVRRHFRSFREAVDPYVPRFMSQNNLAPPPHRPAHRDHVHYHAGNIEDSRGSPPPANRALSFEQLANIRVGPLTTFVRTITGSCRRPDTPHRPSGTFSRSSEPPIVRADTAHIEHFRNDGQRDLRSASQLSLVPGAPYNPTTVTFAKPTKKHPLSAASFPKDPPPLPPFQAPFQQIVLADRDRSDAIDAISLASSYLPK